MEFLVYILAGLIAGILTGLVGLSAAVIIAPVFATFLGMNPFTAIGIALASDVAASGVGAVNFYKHKNINIRGALILTGVVVVFAIIASYASYFTPPFTLNSTINIFVFVLGIRFLVYPVKSGPGMPLLSRGKWIIFQTLLWGAIIGFISGFFGAGGGLSILALLTMLLKYDVKKAIGTSLFVMAFTALVGAGAHFIIEGSILWVPLLVTSVAAVLGSYGSSLLANKVSERVLSYIIGIFLLLDALLEIIELLAIIAERDATIEEMQALIDEKDALIAELEIEIATANASVEEMVVDMCEALDLLPPEIREGYDTYCGPYTPE